MAKAKTTETGKIHNQGFSTGHCDDSCQRFFEIHGEAYVSPVAAQGCGSPAGYLW